MEANIEPRLIAEIGENHLGDTALAAQMVRRAARCGADIVKFQSFDEADLSDDVDAETRDWIKRVQLSEEDQRALKAEAMAAGIQFLSTAVNVRWARFLAELGCPAVKLASLSLANLDLIRFAGENFEEVFISTGMGAEDEIAAALDAVGTKARVTVLHCVSQYPTRDADANLLSVPYLKQRFEVPVGYSDHTIGTEACLAAVALGANLIEKHFTLDKAMEGTDHILSADPRQLSEIAQGISRITAMRGSLGKNPLEGELENRGPMRRLFVEQKIKNIRFDGA